MIAFSKPENMDVYCDVFDNIDDMYMNHTMRFSCENFLAYQLLSHNIDVVPVCFTKAFLLREDNTYDLTMGIRYEMNKLDSIISHND